MNTDTTLRKTRWGGLALLTHQALVIQVMQCWFCNRHRGQWHRLEGPDMDTTIQRCHSHKRWPGGQDYATSASGKTGYLDKRKIEVLPSHHSQGLVRLEMQNP